MYQASFLLLLYFDGVDSLTSNPKMHFLDTLAPWYDKDPVIRNNI